MRTHSFEIEIDSPVESLDSDEGVALAKALHVAGLDDGSLARVESRTIVIVDREHTTFGGAVMDAIDQLDRIPACVVMHVDPVDLVSASQIAERRGHTRQWANNIISGVRGPGGFPAPFPQPRAGATLWRWSDVVSWLDGDTAGTGGRALELRAQSAFLAVLNAVLEVRNRSRDIDAVDDRRRVAALLRSSHLLSA